MICRGSRRGEERKNKRERKAREREREETTDGQTRAYPGFLELKTTQKSSPKIAKTTSSISHHSHHSSVSLSPTGNSIVAARAYDEAVS
jgi:hypothetical protein